LLLYYDKDKDGVISDDELTDAYNDWVDGKITEAEFNYVGYEGYLAGSINNLCPGCYTPTPTPVPTMDKDIYFARLKEKCTNGIIDMDSMPAVFGRSGDNQDKWCNPPIRGRFAGWWSSKEYKGKKAMIVIAINWPQADLPKETCGNPPKSKECIVFQDWDNTVEWNEIPSVIAEESLKALPVKKKVAFNARDGNDNEIAGVKLYIDNELKGET